jgi:hypothetical protein
VGSESPKDNKGDSINIFAPILSQTIEAIHIYLESEIPISSTQTTIDESIDNPTLRKKLEQLLLILDSDNPNLIEPQVRALSGKLPKTSFDKLLTAIENFDFRDAEAIVNALVTDTFRARKE